jgi:hypothetical protein
LAEWREARDWVGFTRVREGVILHQHTHMLNFKKLCHPKKKNGKTLEESHAFCRCRPVRYPHPLASACIHGVREKKIKREVKKVTGKGEKRTTNQMGALDNFFLIRFKPM